MSVGVKDDLPGFVRECWEEVTEQGAPSIFAAIRYMANGQELEVDSVSSKGPSDRWTPEKVAERLEAVITRDARGLNGVTQYQVVVCYGSNPKPSRFLPLQRLGQTAYHHPGGGLATEAATPTGMAQMSMRMSEIVLQGAVAERAAVLQVMASMIRELHDRYREVTTESRELFLGLRKLAIETAATQQDMAIRVIGAKRNAALAHEAFKMMPAALNGLTGREIFPTGTADTVHLRNLMRMFDDDQLKLFAKTASAHGPEAEAAVALLVARLAEIRKEEAAEAEKLREAIGDRHPDEEAAELDAAGLVDPRRVLQSALQTNGGDAGTNGHVGVGEKIVKQLDAAAPKAETSADPFVMRLFEGAGAQEIELLASMYAARGLTDVANELRARYAAFQSEAK